MIDKVLLPNSPTILQLVKVWLILNYNRSMFGMMVQSLLQLIKVWLNPVYDRAKFNVLVQS